MKLRPARALLHPSWILALILLAVNDHVLKGAGLLPSVVTGKLSDFAGLYVAPIVLAAILHVSRRRGLLLCHLATGGVFAAIKVSPWVSQAFMHALSTLGLPWRNWCDATDLVALPALVASFVVLGGAARAVGSWSFARVGAVCVALPVMLGSGGAFTSECDNPNPYRVLALVNDQAFERRDARIRCTDWSPGCSSSTAAPGTTPDDSGTDYDCHCLAYALVAGDFRIDFPPIGVGGTAVLPGGSLTITKSNKVATTCAQGDYYMDYSGVFEGTFGGRTYHRGVFYALEEKTK